MQGLSFRCPKCPGLVVHLIAVRRYALRARTTHCLQMAALRNAPASTTRIHCWGKIRGSYEADTGGRVGRCSGAQVMGR